MNEYKHIEELLERFFEGETSNAEEQELYTFFSGKDIPGHLSQYKSVFEYFESTIFDEFSEINKEGLPKNNLKVKPILMSISGVAASVLLILSCWTFYQNNTATDLYEGSYIIENGVRISDVKQIKSQLEEVEKEAFYRQQKMEQLLEEANRVSDYDTRSEEIQKRHYGFLNEIENENIRNRIKNSIE
ncbi:MAG: hypothetical protein E6772_03390 [Dysgonomonas sp.]|nr:hypothetical protein [Dysgonomonas sp.]